MTSPSSHPSPNQESVGPFTVNEFHLILDIEDILAWEYQAGLWSSRIARKCNRIMRFHALVLEMPQVARNQLVDAELGSELDILGYAHLGDFDLRLPGRTILGKALIDLEISFWAFVAACVEETVRDVGDRTMLLEHVERSLCGRIYNRMTAELLASLVAASQVTEKHRRRAASFLLSLWEDTVVNAMRNFAPLLESIWNARRHVHVSIGTLMGISEISQLLQLGATPHFVTFFAENFEENEIAEAFQEFLFGITYEEIVEKTRERDQMGLASAQGLDLDATGLPRGPSNSLVERSLGIYRFFKKRIQEARSRRITGAAGPKRIAEEYLLLYFIEYQL